MLDRPAIYVRRITNLSDARYCAGMGVDMLGFIIDPSDADYVSPEQFQAMVGWVAGPRRVVEVTGAVKDWNEVVDQYKPDLLHGSWDILSAPGVPDLPLIVEMSLEQFASSPKLEGAKVEYLLISNYDARSGSISGNGSPLLISLDQTQEGAREILQRSGAQGVTLQGSRELVPGFKDYDHLSRILEELSE